MANIKLVITIDEDDFEIMKHNIAVNNPLCPLNQEEMVAIVAHGTPLPKGHGDLIDRNDLDITTITTDDYSGNEVIDVILKEDVDGASPIIEADKEKEEC